MKLLREYYELCEGGVCQDLLTEEERRFVAAGGMYLTGKLQQANTQNGNGRIYPYNVLVREVKNYQKLVKESRALGELDHPDDSVINLKNASHLVTSIWMDGDTVMGKVKVLDTPSGKVLKSLVESGVKLGISSRGMGSVDNRNGQTIVQDDFQLICFDFVSEPSTPEAFMVKEAKQYNNKVFTKADRINRLLNEVLKDGSLRRFDKGGEVFYDQISALHKAVRGSDPDASLYWFARMLDGGCDPFYIIRRIVRIASEDIGNADPRAIRLALDAWEAHERLGSPEGELAIAHAIVYLACAAKSNAVYKAFNLAMKDAVEFGSKDVPLHLRNAPTKLMEKLDYGKDYQYAHNEPDAYVAGEHYFPDGMEAKKYYHPVDRGLEIKIAEKLATLRERDKEVNK